MQSVLSVSNVVSVIRLPSQAWLSQLLLLKNVIGSFHISWAIFKKGHNVNQLSVSISQLNWSFSAKTPGERRDEVNESGGHGRAATGFIHFQWFRFLFEVAWVQAAR